MFRKMLFLILAMATILIVQAQEFNYDESKVPEFILPDPLVGSDGSRVSTSGEWESTRRQEILSMFEQYVYGSVPEGDYDQTHEIVVQQENALGGLADRYEVKITIERQGKALSFNMLVYLPANARGPVPLIIGYNRLGNHMDWHKDQ